MMGDVLTVTVRQHSIMSLPTSSDPEWDRYVEQDTIDSEEDVPIFLTTTISPQRAVTQWCLVGHNFRYVDGPSQTAPGAGIVTCSFSSDPGWGGEEVQLGGVFDSVDIPSPTSPVTVTSSGSSQHSEDPESYTVSEMDLLDRGQYLIQSFTGEGSFGTVAKAQSTFTGDSVAIKILKNRPGYDEMAAREVRYSIVL